MQPTTPTIIPTRRSSDLNLSKDNKTNLEKQRNRELLAMIEEAFHLDYQIEERVERGGGIKVVERVYVNQEHLFERSEEHTTELQSRDHLVYRLLLEINKI